jgi:hypothetical protein
MDPGALVAVGRRPAALATKIVRVATDLANEEGLSLCAGDRVAHRDQSALLYESHGSRPPSRRFRGQTNLL